MTAFEPGLLNLSLADLPLVKENEHLKDYVNFLSELLRADVELVDRNFRRVVGTGYYESADDLISGGAIYAEVFQTERYVIIQDPRKHSICEKCRYRSRCLEKMEIAYPVMFGGILLGAVGVGCTNASQRENILENLKLFMFLINKTCMFIGKKIASDSALSRSLKRIEELEIEVAEKVASMTALGAVRKLADVERDEIEKALDAFGRDTAGKQKAAKALGIGIATLYRKINEEK